jgi:hypothetical protein
LSILSNVGVEAQQKLAAYVERSLDIFLAHGLIRMVTNPTGAAQKQHGRGQNTGHHDGIMTGATGHALQWKAGGFNGHAEQGSQSLVHRNGSLLQLASVFKLQAAALGNGSGAGQKLFYG